LLPYAVTPAQSPDGKLFMFFGTIPQELTFYGPAPVATFIPVTVRISIPDEEEDSIALTSKGISNNVMVSPTTSPKRRRRPSKKTAPTAAAQVTRNSQVSRKRALDAYQNQLVARPAIPVSNKFTALRIVAKYPRVTNASLKPLQKPFTRLTGPSNRGKALETLGREHMSPAPVNLKIWLSRKPLSRLHAQEGLHLRQHLASCSQ
jgi:hypothetical protein